MSKKHDSSQHHYIPQFFIRGFRSTDGPDLQGPYYVYNKLYDKIYDSRYVSSKQIFYEDGRNNVTEGGVTDSYLEGKGYTYFDTIHAPFIDELRTKPVDSVLRNTKDLREFLYFRLLLFWRNPFADEGYAEYFKKGKVHVKNEKGELGEEVSKAEAEKYIASEKAQKANRLLAVEASINELDHTQETVVFSHRIYEAKYNAFLLGDYPIVYINQPTSLGKVATNQLYLPISPTRIYYNKLGDALKFTGDDIAAINALIIHQSKEYICSANKELLRSFVDFYKMVKARSEAEGIDMFYHLRMRIFALVSKR